MGPGLARRIRDLYRCQRHAVAMPVGSADFTAADVALRQAIAAMQPKPTPSWPTPSSRTVPQGPGKPAGALARLDPLCRRLRNPDGQQRLRTQGAGPRRGSEKLLWIGSVVERSLGGDVVFPVRHLEQWQDEHPHLANVVPAKLCRNWWPSPSRHQFFPALEHVAGKAPRVGHRSRRTVPELDRWRSLTVSESPRTGRAPLRRYICITGWAKLYARGHAPEISCSLLCDRPGCYELPVTSIRNPARYCCPACRQAVRNIQDRERKWRFRGTLAGRTRRAYEYQAARQQRLRRRNTSVSVPLRSPPE